MESRRRQRWDNSRRSQYRHPHRGNWQPSVPSWEKDFCKEVGSMDWETLLQMKKFMHLYANVITWNDSAGEEAFRNAKKRYWAEINGRSCDVSLPNPDLYIDKINWDSETDPDPLQDLESEPVIPNAEQDHEPVVIFGDSIMPDQAFSPAGWGDNEENVHVSTKKPECGGPWEQNWGDPLNNRAPHAWPVYSNDWGWSDANDHFNYVGTGWSDKRHDGNVATAYADRYMSFYANPRVQGKDGRNGNHVSRNDVGRYKGQHWGEQSGVDKRSASRKWNPVNSCGPVGYPAGIAVGRMWNGEKRVS